MKKVLITLTLGLAVAVTHAQLYIGSDANSLVIKSGESFSYDGLTLTPSADFSLTNTTLTKTEAHTISSIAPVTSGNYIRRYFSFSSTTPAFTGTLRFSYTGADLTGSTSGSAIPEADLRLNIFNGTNWSAMTDLPDQTNDFVSGTLTSRTLNVITLASTSGALPVTWLKFTAEKKQSTSLLQWATATEQNTQDFLVQHSVMGSDWKTLGSVRAAGNATTRKDYAITHYTPAPGYNYYRLIQRDQDGQFSYSKVATVLMDKDDIKLKVFPNPVQDGKLNVVLKEATQVRLFDAAGRQVLTQRLNAGLQTLNVSGLQGGVYNLRAGSETIAIIIK
jgi:hypothetical protein